jgi:hypothetical protein
MALSIKKDEFPAKKIMDGLLAKFNKLNIVQKALTVGAIVAGLALGAVGIVALVGFATTSLLGASLLAAGILTGIPALFNFAATAIRTLYTFNWAISDTEIDKQLEGRLNSLYSNLGEGIGAAVGWFTCGILPGALTFAFNPAVAGMVLANVTAEAAEEVWGELAGLQHGAVQLLGQALTLKAFKSARRYLKKKDSPFYSILKAHFGDRIDKWGEDGQPSFSFSQQVEERVEKIEDEKLRNFTEEFIESLVDSCCEALQFVGRDIGTHMAAQAMMGRHTATARPGLATVQLDFSRDDDAGTAPAPTT